MPSRASLAKEQRSVPAFKASKDGLNSIRANVAGDFKLKSMAPTIAKILGPYEFN